MSSSDEAFFQPLDVQPVPLDPQPGDISQIDFDIAFYERILERSPRYLDILRCVGELLTRKGLHRRALEVDRQLVALLPDDGIVYYNLACSLAQVGRRAEAIAALRTALERGYEDVDYLAIDSDLDSLRNEPAYRELLAQYMSDEDSSLDE